MKLFSHVRHWSDIGRCVFHNSCLILISAAKLQNSYEISKFLEPPRANMRYGADFDGAKYSEIRKSYSVNAVAHLLNVIKSI